MNWNRTLSLIPDGVQSSVKKPSNFVEGVYPKYISHGKGCKVYADGKEYVDYTCGTNLLGYANEDVTQAVFAAVRKGNLFGIPHEDETLLAEKIVEHFLVDKVRLVQTNTEATTAAVRMARTYTDKITILSCGQHGWHDPRDYYNSFEYNDITALRNLFKRHKDVAAVIMEPYIYKEPKVDFLEEVRRTCTQNNALLIFNETITGFRTNRWCAATEFKVQPDLMCLGGGMGNGFPIAAVCGSGDVMDVLTKKCDVSPLFGGELSGVAAALAVINFIEKRGVFMHLKNMGERVRANFNIIAGNEGVHAEGVGYGQRTMFKFKDQLEKKVFWQECAKKGVLFGDSNYISFAHDLGDADSTVVVIRHALRMIRKYAGHVRDLEEAVVS